MKLFHETEVKLEVYSQGFNPQNVGNTLKQRQGVNRFQGGIYLLAYCILLVGYRSNCSQQVRGQR